MLLVLLFQDGLPLPWEKMLYGAQGFAVLAIILFFLLRVLPTWKDIKMKEFDTRDKDSDARAAQAESMKAIADVLYKVAVEQRRAADSVKILQRVNSTRVEDVEAAVTGSLEKHEERISRLEKNATHNLTANPATAN